jgi:anti-sigma factor RsiW
MKDETRPAAHLTDEELFGLALPPVGQPEALPAHLSACRACSRALQEWKQAVGELAAEADGALDRRAAADWDVRSRETMEKIRASGAPARRGSRQAVVGLLLAAAMLLFALLAPRQQAPGPVAPVEAAASAELSPADEADDALLRDVQRLARGEEIWNPLAPEEPIADESL